MICLILLAHPSCSELGFTSWPEWLENRMFPPRDAILWRCFSKYSFIILAGILWPSTWPLRAPVQLPQGTRGWVAWTSAHVLPFACRLAGSPKVPAFSQAASLEMNWMCDGGKGQRPVDTEHPHPRGTLGGTPCPVLPLAARAVILIMGLRWWMASWLHHAALNKANGSWRRMPSLGPAHHSLPAVGRGLSLGAQGMHDLGWNGGQSWQSRMRAPLSLAYCVFIQKARWEPSRELDRQSIAIKHCTFLHVSSAHPSEVPLRKDKWEGGDPNGLHCKQTMLNPQ